MRTHLVRFGSSTACGFDKLPDGDKASHNYTDCPSCMPAPPEVPDELKPTPKEARIAFLEKKRLVTIEDAKVKLEAEDWHGIQDCGSDLRDIDNELDGLRF